MLSVVCAVLSSSLVACTSLLQPRYELVDGAASAKVFTWVDADADGDVDPYEEPLPWVTTSVVYPDFLTAEDGWGQPWTFKPGCAASCWEGHSVKVKAPPGYTATTPLEFPLNGADEAYYFGFRLDPGATLPRFPDEPTWYLAFVHRGAKLSSFHYSQDGQLSISLPKDAYPDHYYGDEYENEYFLDLYLVDIVLDLVRSHDARIDTLRVGLLPSSETITCTTGTLGQWDGKIPASEILAEHCQHD
jgi:hypothetical protein